MISLPLLATLVLVALAAGYLVYGKFLARQFTLDDARTTPATEVNDGEDYVPTKRFYLLGQHFSAIAAAGPIVGPIAACLRFGWLPCILWIGLGVIFIGAVHDFAALIASVRHKANSVAEIVKENVGPRAWVAMLVFIWIALIYVIVAFTEATTLTFLGKDELMEGETYPFNPGGAVAAASTLYLLLALVMGLVQRKWKLPLPLVTAIFVPAAFGAVWAGTLVSTHFALGREAWIGLILVYCFVASLTPVWALLQPRGYLGGFVLYAALAVGVVGIFFGGFEIKQPALTDAPIAGMGKSLFPFLFVTIACGACSGFHGLVCSGTTSKQIAKESHCRPVGYGAMLLEGFVALIALSTVIIVSQEDIGGRKEGVLYGDGMALYLTKIIGPDHMRFARTFGAMVFSTFVFDTLDVATRLGRYILQELTKRSGRTMAVAATAITVAVPATILLTGRQGSFRDYWDLFGTSNQLLAALTLLGISVWLKRTGRRAWFTLAPMVFVMTITLWSLVSQIADPVTPGTNRVVAGVMLALAVFLITESAMALRRVTVARA